jgi:hypothetical protein
MSRSFDISALDARRYPNSYATWVAAHSTKTRRHSGAFVFTARPSTAEMRRWLRDKATPRHIKLRLYSALQYRRHRR